MRSTTALRLAMSSPQPPDFGVPLAVCLQSAPPPPGSARLPRPAGMRWRYRYARHGSESARRVFRPPVLDSEGQPYYTKRTPTVDLAAIGSTCPS